MISTGNHRQFIDAAAVHQQEMSLPQPLHLARKTKLAPIEEVALCQNLGDAYFHTFKSSGKPRKAICAETGIDSSVLTRIFTGTKNMPQDKEIRFYEACGNYFAFQWKAYQMGLVCDKRDLTDREKALMFDRIQQQQTRAAG